MSDQQLCFADLMDTIMSDIYIHDAFTQMVPVNWYRGPTGTPDDLQTEDDIAALEPYIAPVCIVAFLFM